MTHAINFVDEAALPEGQDFLFVSIPSGALIFYRESALSPAVLEDSWAAYRACADDGHRGTPSASRHLSLVSTG